MTDLSNKHNEYKLFSPDFFRDMEFDSGVYTKSTSEKHYYYITNP